MNTISQISKMKMFTFYKIKFKKKKVQKKFVHQSYENFCWSYFLLINVKQSKRQLRFYRKDTELVGNTSIPFF